MSESFGKVLPWALEETLKSLIIVAMTFGCISADDERNYEAIKAENEARDSTNYVTFQFGAIERRACTFLPSGASIEVLEDSGGSDASRLVKIRVTDRNNRSASGKSWEGYVPARAIGEHVLPTYVPKPPSKELLEQRERLEELKKRGLD